jgi:hypothetical protein
VRARRRSSTPLHVRAGHRRAPALGPAGPAVEAGGHGRPVGGGAAVLGACPPPGRRRRHPRPRWRLRWQRRRPTWPPSSSARPCRSTGATATAASTRSSAPTGTSAGCASSARWRRSATSSASGWPPAAAPDHRAGGRHKRSATFAASERWVTTPSPPTKLGFAPFSGPRLRKIWPAAGVSFGSSNSFGVRYLSELWRPVGRAPWAQTIVEIRPWSRSEPRLALHVTADWRSASCRLRR